MVQIINDPTRGSIFGRLGKGIGAGLSEQIPKEVDRARLSHGLRNLAQKGSQLSPLQQAAEYLSLPGISPAAIQILPELLRQQGISEEGPVTPSSQQPVTDSSGKTVSPQPSSFSSPNQSGSPTSLNPKNLGKEATQNIYFQPPSSHNFTNQFRSLTNPEDIQRVPLPVMTEEQKEARDYELRRSHPKRFRTLEEARVKTDAEEASRLKQFETARQKRINDLNLQSSTLSALTTARERLLQKKGDETYSDIPGTAEKVFDQIALDQVAKGKSPENAAEDVAQDQFNFARARTNIKNFGKESIGRASDKLIKDLKSGVEEYRKYNQLPLFVQDAQDFNGIGPHLASAIGYGISPSLYSSVPKLTDQNIKRTKSASTIDNIIKNIGEEDSIFALGMLLNENGWNDGEVISQLQSKATLGEFKPTVEQKLELDKYTPLQLTLGDILNSALMGLTGKAKLPSNEAIRRKFWGKR